MSTEAPALTKKDFQSDQEVRWCPGCGDYAILSAVQSVFPELGIPKENIVVISGIGCSSRFPYYMNTYGFHTIHGRAPAVATGLKMTRPELSVWVVTGDGDSMSIGGNHFIHALRRNVGLKILMFNNRIYGLTKGQYSPTSEPGKRTKSTPMGSVDYPFNPLSLAIGAGATFVARSVDIFQPHLKSVLKAAAAHEGTAFVEIFQNCNIFNDKAFANVTDKENRQANVIYLEDKKPVVVGAEGDRGVHLGPDGDLAVTAVGEGGRSAEELLIWDTSRENPNLAFQMAQFEAPTHPVPIGIFRQVERPSYESGVLAQIKAAEDRGPGKLEDLLRGGDTWQVG